MRRLDAWLEQRINRVLPASLTKRYVLGLGVVALIVCAAQLFEQASFGLQARAFRQARLIDEQAEASLVFSRAVQQLRYAASQGVLEDRIQIAESSFRDLAARQNLVNNDNHPVYTGIGEQRSLNIYYSLTVKSLGEIEQKLGELRTKVVEKTGEGDSLRVPRRQAAIVEDILKNEHLYRTTLEDLSLFYESRIVSRIQLSRALSLAATVLVIFLLAFTGLYVIRPAVRQLFEAVDTRSKFLGRMGNEIRNPMNSIMGMTRLLQNTTLSEQQRHYISVLNSSSNSLMGLLNNLIDYSRISSGKVMLEYCDIDLLNAVQDCIDLVTYKADRKELDLLLSVDPQTSLRVTTDPLVLQQILLNLLENAVKFTEKGKVTVSIWQTRDFGRSRLHVSVADTGIGISPDKLNEIFDYFQQEDPSILRRYGGSGLGLGICLELVKLTGGQIDVQSQKGQGSVFHFYLPVNRFSEETFEDLFKARTMSGRRALILEGNKERREKLLGYIRAYGGVPVIPEPEEGGQPRTEDQWRAYFVENDFDLYVLSYEHNARLISALQMAQEQTNRPLLPRMVVLLRSTLPSSRIMRLNSIGVKTFCYIPVKPIEFLAAIDLVLQSRGAPPPERAREASRMAEKLARFELSRPISALVVDDSRDNQYLMKSYLEKHAGHMVIADNGEEALEKFKQNNFDIVFMDLLMPEIDGYEAARQMRAWEAQHGRKGVPIVAVSAHTGPEEVEKCRVSGFTAHLSKPLDLGELQSFMGRVFGEKVASVEKKQGGDVDENWQKKLKEYLPNYYRQRGEDLKKMRAAVESGEWDKLVFIGHKIKGSAATYGFPELGQAGAELEQFAQEKDLAQVNSRIEYIESWLKTVSP